MRFVHTLSHIPAAPGTVRLQAHLALFVAPPGGPRDTSGAIKTAVASMTPKGLILLLGAALLALPDTSWGQKPLDVAR